MSARDSCNAGRPVVAGGWLGVDWLNGHTLLRVVRVSANGADQPAQLCVIGKQTRVQFEHSSCVAATVRDEASWMRAVCDRLPGLESPACKLVSLCLPFASLCAQVQSVRAAVLCAGASVSPPSGWLPHSFLLHGLPGTGKSAVARAVADASRLPVFAVAGSESFRKFAGASEAALSELFARAVAAAPSFLLLDDVDALSPWTEETANSRVERRLVACLCSLLDSLTPSLISRPPRPGVHVFVIASTNRLAAVDSAVRRSGCVCAYVGLAECCSRRLDCELEFRPQRSDARLRILRGMCSRLPISLSSRTPTDDSKRDDAKDRDAVLEQASNWTQGFVGADLERLSRDVTVRAVMRAANATQSDSEGKTSFSMEQVAKRLNEMLRGDLPASVRATELDFMDAIERSRPSSLHGPLSFIGHKSASSNDREVDLGSLGGLDELAAKLRLALLAPVLRPQLFASLRARLGVRPAAGALLYGPSGTGKVSTRCCNLSCDSRDALCRQRSRWRLRVRRS